MHKACNDPSAERRPTCSQEPIRHLSGQNFQGKAASHPILPKANGRNPNCPRLFGRVRYKLFVGVEYASRRLNHIG